MKCDFYRDLNNKIWLFYAYDILSRNRIKSDAEKLENDAIQKQKTQMMEQQQETIRKRRLEQREER